MPEPTVPAAAYVRADADAAPAASIPAQRARLETFAQAHSLSIVRWFVDDPAYAAPDPSSRPDRRALDMLRAQAANGCDFEFVLALDAARFDRNHPGDWQSLDAELRAAGVPPLYAAEPRRNDGRALGQRLKALYAGEFRDDARRARNAAIAAGRRRALAQGFHGGAPAPFGLRRQMIGWNQEGRVMERGEGRPHGRYRSVLVPGPPWEVDTVNRIFALYVHGGLSMGQIARRLNAEPGPPESLARLGRLGHGPGVGRDRRVWRAGAVRKILTNPIYTGTRVSGRRSTRADPPPVVVIEGVCEPIVTRALFDAAAECIRARRRRFTDKQIVAGLKRLLDTHGAITRELVDGDPELPGWITIGTRFGRIGQAMAKVGYAKPTDWEARRAMGRERGS